MSKTRLSVMTALALAGCSLAVFGVRWSVLGDDIGGLQGASTWKVTLVASGTLLTEDGYVHMALPPDFRSQHIFDERSVSQELAVIKSKYPNRRELLWRRALPHRGAQLFLLSYQCRCRVGMPRPTLSMERSSRELDAPPADSELLKPTARIESDHQEIFDQARLLVQPEHATAIDQVQALYDYVAGLAYEPTLNTRSALECLRSGSGSAGDKSRLLVALCRNRGIPARLVCGLILEESKGSSLHWWMEAWVNQQWWPMCPAHRHFGPRNLPRNYLVWQIGDNDPVRCRGGDVRYEFLVQDLHSPFGPEVKDASAIWLFSPTFWRKLSLHNLQTAEQHLVKFLLLLPVAALVVSLCRTVIGVPTFGTFGPALLGLMFFGARVAVLPWVVGIFLLTVLLGWSLRRLLDRFHLLQVPRVSALLTLIVVLLIVMIVTAHHLGIKVAHYVTLFPLVILTHLIERFWMVEAEDGTGASFRTLLGTLVVAFAAGLAVLPPQVADGLLTYPEALGLVLAAQFLLGRYTGYRLAELYRFRDLLTETRAPVNIS